METNESERSWGVWYLLGGLVVGAAAGLLLAPKSGSETRGEIEEWRLRGRRKAQAWLDSVGEAIPFRVKARIGAMRNGAREALETSADKVKSMVGS